MLITLVSIIVPCYKQAHYLNESLQSVLEQSYNNWECIIVNDGSPDNTKEVANLWCEKDKRFVYVEKENGGLSSARNAGINVSKGAFILPLDSDDIISPLYLEKLVPILNNSANLAIVSCYSNFFTNDIFNIVYQLKPKGFDYKYLLYVNQLVATSLYRKSSWEAVGGYDETMKSGFEDWEFWIRLTKGGLNYHIEKDFLFYYRKAKTSMLVDTINNHAEANKEYIFKKHKELYIDDFDNCMTVMYHHIKTHKNAEHKIKNSIEYKIAKALMKPFKMLKKITSK